MRQPIGSSAEGTAQRHERPGRGAIGFPVGRAAGFGKDAGALGHAIGRRWTTPMPRDDSREALLIEAGDELGNSIAGAPAGGMGSGGVGLPRSNRE